MILFYIFIPITLLVALLLQTNIIDTTQLNTYKPGDIVGQSGAMWMIVAIAVCLSFCAGFHKANLMTDEQKLESVSGH